MAEHVAEFQAHVNIAVVTMSKPTGLSAYLAQRPWPFPVWCDPERKAYATLGLARTSWGRILRWGSITRYLGLMWKGWKIRRIPEGEDPLQLGGNFLLDRQCRLVWAFRSEDATVRPTPAEILQAISTSLVDD